MRRRQEETDDDIPALAVSPSVGSIVQLSESTEDEEDLPEKNPIGFTRLREREDGA